MDDRASHINVDLHSKEIQIMIEWLGSDQVKTSENESWSIKVIKLSEFKLLNYLNSSYDHGNKMGNLAIIAWMAKWLSHMEGMWYDLMFRLEF